MACHHPLPTAAALAPAGRTARRGGQKRGGEGEVEVFPPSPPLPEPAKGGDGEEQLEFEETLPRTKTSMPLSDSARECVAPAEMEANEKDGDCGEEEEEESCPLSTATGIGTWVEERTLTSFSLPFSSSSSTRRNPSCPLSLSPKPKREPDSQSTSVWLPPQATAERRTPPKVGFFVGDGTLREKQEEFFFSLLTTPHWPLRFPPHVQRAPSESKAAQWCAPAEIEVIRVPF